MSPAEVRSIFEEEGSDKTTGHRYDHVYSLIAPGIPASGAILEIGYQDGGGLAGLRRILSGRPYAAYRRYAAIDVSFGRDRYPDAEIDRITCDMRSAAAIATAHTWLGPPGMFALIVDDASHRLDDQQRGLDAFWDLLMPGGLYVIEDIPDLGHAYRFAGYPGFVALDTRPLASPDDLCVVMRA